MGCLFRLILFPFELIFDAILEGWFALMQWIVPEERLGFFSRWGLKILVGVFSIALLLVFLFGVLVAAFTEATVTDLWPYIFIPLGISVLQIVFGIAVRIKSRKK